MAPQARIACSTRNERLATQATGSGGWLPQPSDFNVSISSGVKRANVSFMRWKSASQYSLVSLLCSADGEPDVDSSEACGAPTPSGGVLRVPRPFNPERSTVGSPGEGNGEDRRTTRQA